MNGHRRPLFRERFERSPIGLELRASRAGLERRLREGSVELAREILRIRPDLPIILCTGYSETVDEESALAIGIKAFMLKPFSVREIAGAIRRVLPPRPGAIEERTVPERQPPRA